MPKYIQHQTSKYDLELEVSKVVQLRDYVIDINKKNLLDPLHQTPSLSRILGKTHTHIIWTVKNPTVLEICLIRRLLGDLVVGVLRSPFCTKGR